MELEIMTIVLCAGAFLVAGLVDSIAGGGGLITVPSLLLFGIPPHYALGTSKMASTLGTLTAVWTFWRNGLIAMQLVPLGFTAAFLGAAGGSWLAMQIESVMLGKIIAFMLPIGLVCSLFAGRTVKEEKELPIQKQRIITVIIAIIIGAYDGFFGPGTGSFFIIGLHLLLHMGLVKASGTAKVLNLASNAGGFAAFATGGVVLYALALPCAVGSIVGNQLGARLAIRVGVKAVRLFLYVTLSLLFATLLYRFVFIG